MIKAKQYSRLLTGFGMQWAETAGSLALSKGDTHSGSNDG